MKTKGNESSKDFIHDKLISISNELSCEVSNIPRMVISPKLEIDRLNNSNENYMGVIYKDFDSKFCLNYLAYLSSKGLESVLKKMRLYQDEFLNNKAYLLNYARNILCKFADGYIDY